MGLRVIRLAGLFLFAVLFTAPAYAQVVHSLHIGGGAFMPRGYAGRTAGDVLVENLNSLYFTKCRAGDFNSCLRREFTSGQLFGEWLVAFGDHIEFGAGAGFSSASAPAAYSDYTHPDDGTFTDLEIRQELSLRIIPVTGVVRVLAGHPGTFQPYAGGGVAALNFRYTEAGEFIDFNDFSTFRTRYVAKGTTAAPVLLAGFKAPIKGDIWGFTMEWRWQGGTGNTGGLQKGFLTDKIDLGGNNINFGFLVRY